MTDAPFATDSEKQGTMSLLIDWFHIQLCVTSFQRSYYQISGIKQWRCCCAVTIVSSMPIVFNSQRGWNYSSTNQRCHDDSNMITPSFFPSRWSIWFRLHILSSMIHWLYSHLPFTVCSSTNCSMTMPPWFPLLRNAKRSFLNMYSFNPPPDCFPRWKRTKPRHF